MSMIRLGDGLYRVPTHRSAITGQHRREWRVWHEEGRGWTTTLDSRTALQRVLGSLTWFKTEEEAQAAKRRRKSR